MKVIAILQARMGSSRFPGKILAPLADLPLIGVVRTRTDDAPIDDWWLATTEGDDDDVTEFWGEQLGYRVERGAIEDVLSRFTNIVRIVKPDWVLRMTADNPFVDGALLRHLIAGAADAEPDVELVDLPSIPALPIGYGASVVRGSALLRAEKRIPKGLDHHRAHVTTWIRENGTCSSVDLPGNWPSRGQYRWTVDTPADYMMVKRVFELLGSDWDKAGYLDIVQILDQHPNVVDLNLHVRQKNETEG